MRNLIKTKKYNQGFSLLEIMVGIVIGLISVLAIYQLYNLSEGRRRTTSAQSEAQTVGAIALYEIEKDIKSAGLGFGTGSEFFNCNVVAFNSLRATQDFNFNFLPVEIIAGANFDEIRVLYGNSSYMAYGQGFETAAASQASMVVGASGLALGLQLGDTAILADSVNNCEMVEITGNTGAGVANSVVQYRPNGTYTDFYTGDASKQATRNRAGAAFVGVQGQIFNLGPAPELAVWQVANARLTRHNFLNETTAIEVAGDVVGLRAQYGYDADNDGILNLGSEWIGVLPATPAYDRIYAVRVALLVRSSHFNKEEVTIINPQAWPSVNFNMAIYPNWQHYRYRVYESVIPLRNVRGDVVL